MSIGYGGYARLRQADESMLLYSYCCYDINLDNWREMKEAEDGELWIERSALVEPRIHKRIKRSPSGRKRIQTKRIEQYVHIGDLLSAGKVFVRNASGTWKTRESGVDMIAVVILRRIFSEYQRSGEVPKSVSMFV